MPTEMKSMITVKVRGKTLDVNTDKLSDDDYRRIVIRGLESYLGEKGPNAIKTTIRQAVNKPTPMRKV
jgi:hypothetical protein